MGVVIASNFAAAVAMYIVGVAMPGPGNLSIANASMMHGRAKGMAQAAGVISGSLCWGVTAAAGMSAVLLSYKPLLTWIKILGALYLGWLAYRAIKGAFLSQGPLRAVANRGRGGLAAFYMQGLGIHLTNPKAVLTWLAVTTIGLSGNASPWVSFALVACCGFLGLCIFTMYAFAFSSKSAAPFLERTRRPFGLFCGAFYFALAAAFIFSLQ